MSQRPFQLVGLTVGDDPATWQAAGFHVADGSTTVGRTVIALVGADRGRGILAATIAGPVGPTDGLPFEAATAPPADDADGPAHPNGVVHLDHLVAMSPDMDRTTSALSDAGLEHRRTRTFDTDQGTRRQAFFWLGDVILELVGDDAAHGEGPARLWGLALTSEDLDRTARHLDDRLGTVGPAVQPGRRIATLRTRELGISVPIALMSPHPGS